MAKNIYQVVDTKTRKIVQVGFQKKEEARILRNELNEKHKSVTVDDSKPRFVISRGSDHYLGETDGVTVKTMKKRGPRKRKLIKE